MADASVYLMNNYDDNRQWAVGSRQFIEVRIMSGKDILKKALKLKPGERFLVVEGLINSLDQPDESLDKIWADEAEKRLTAYRAGKLEGIPMEDIFKEDL